MSKQDGRLDCTAAVVLLLLSSPDPSISPTKRRVAFSLRLVVKSPCKSVLLAVPGEQIARTGINCSPALAEDSMAARPRGKRVQTDLLLDIVSMVLYTLNMYGIPVKTVLVARLCSSGLFARHTLLNHP